MAESKADLLQFILTNLRDGWSVFIISLLGIMFSVGMAYSTLHARNAMAFDKIEQLEKAQADQESRHKQALESIDRRLQSIDNYLRDRR